MADQEMVIPSFWAKYGRYIIIAACVVVLVVIFFWPQKTGDVRNGNNGQPEIYWRGPDPQQPGAWLPKDPEVSGDLVVPKLGTIGTKVNDKTVVDLVGIGGGKCVIVLESNEGVKTAAIVKNE